jgi:NADH:ubiquinone oxidoreductase subunit F (NADH-binding)
MLFTVAGDVRRGRRRAAARHALRALVEDAGGGVVGGRAMKAIVPGSSTTALVDSSSTSRSTSRTHGERRIGARVRRVRGLRDESACIVQVAHLYSRFLWVDVRAVPPCKFGAGEITAHLSDRGRQAARATST